MNDLMTWLWQFNLELSLLLILILLARALLRRFVRLYNNYLLWFSVPLAVTVANWVKSLELAKPVAASVQPMQTAVQDYVQGYLIQPAATFDAWFLTGVLATTIAAALLLRLVLQHWNLRRELRRITDGEALSIASSFSVMEVTKNDFSPAVYGFFRPKIYFPKGLINCLSQQQIELIVQHEEQHIKQGHLWLNLVWDVLVCLLWFNPLLYFARLSFRHDQELYCDYIVLKNSDLHSRRSYGHALLSTVSATHSVSLLCSWKMFNQLEERIMNIKSTFNMPKKLLLSLFATLLVCCASAYSLAMAGNVESKVKIVVDDRVKKKVKVINNGVTFIDEGGEKYVVEEGERRELTDEELAKYEGLIEGIDLEKAIELGIDGASDGSRRLISIVSDNDDHEFEILSGMLEGIEAIDIDAITDVRIAHSSNVEHQLEKALRSVEKAREKKNANKAQLNKSVKELKEVKKQLAADLERVRKTREKARLAAKNARKQIRGAH